MILAHAQLTSSKIGENHSSSSRADTTGGNRGYAVRSTRATQPTTRNTDSVTGSTLDPTLKAQSKAPEHIWSLPVLVLALFGRVLFYRHYHHREPVMSGATHGGGANADRDQNRKPPKGDNPRRPESAGSGCAQGGHHLWL
jgi:hypothetical protein